MAIPIPSSFCPSSVHNLGVGVRLPLIQQAPSGDCFSPCEQIGQNGLMSRGDFWKACQTGPRETLGPLHGSSGLLSAAEEAAEMLKTPLHPALEKAHRLLGPLSAVTKLDSDNPGDVADGALDLSESAAKWLAEKGPRALVRVAGEVAEHATPLGHLASAYGLTLDSKASGELAAELEHANSWQDPNFNARVETEKSEQRFRQGGLQIAAQFETMAVVPGVGVVFACLGAATEVGVKAFTDDRDELVHKGIIPEHGYYG